MSFASSWRDCEIMFHVAPLMPLRENDKQQVHRKRYIGNGMCDAGGVNMHVCTKDANAGSCMCRYCLHCVCGRKNGKIRPRRNTIPVFACLHCHSS